MPERVVLVTGAAGFIGSAVCRLLARDPETTLVCLDKMTYAANPAAYDGIVVPGGRHRAERVDIADAAALARVFATHKPSAVLHLAAESHVDRSIDGPGAFIETNIVGTYRLLEAALCHWRGLHPVQKAAFRFHHVSTDEVFGALGDDGAFTHDTPYAPNSPYAASKAASDHLVRAWHKTYGLPVLLTNCSNNYGPFQFPEKLIPLVILNGLAGQPLPVYGTGANVRDWLYVEDHADALALVLRQGAIGGRYLIGGGAEYSNLAVVTMICALLDEMAPKPYPHRDLIRFVPDRPGHDHRYAIDARFIHETLGWTPRHGFAAGLRATVRWYLDHQDWCRMIRDRGYGGERLGLSVG